MKRIICLLFALAMMVIPLAGCSGSSDTNSSSQEETSQQTAQEKLSEVINAVYANVENSTLADATDQILKEEFFLDPEDVEEYAVRYTDFRYGVSDVCIVKPAEGKKQDVLDAFSSRQQARMAQCENYDIHNSYAISKGAEIYERGLRIQDNGIGFLVIEKENHPFFSDQISPIGTL